MTGKNYDKFLTMPENNSNLLFVIIFKVSQANHRSLTSPSHGPCGGGGNCDTPQIRFTM